MANDSAVILLRVSTKLKRAAVTAARKENMSVSSWIRGLVADDLGVKDTIQARSARAEKKAKVKAPKLKAKKSEPAKAARATKPKARKDVPAKPQTKASKKAKRQAKTNGHTNGNGSHAVQAPAPEVLQQAAPPQPMPPAPLAVEPQPVQPVPPQPVQGALPWAPVTVAQALASQLPPVLPGAMAFQPVPAPGQTAQQPAPPVRWGQLSAAPAQSEGVSVVAPPAAPTR